MQEPSRAIVSSDALSKGLGTNPQRVLTRLIVVVCTLLRVKGFEQTIHIPWLQFANGR